VVKIRRAEKGDMAGIRDLIRLFPGQLVQRNLPRVSSFFVATAGDKIIGCCALQVYSKRLSEVRSLAVHPDYQEQRVAAKLVECCKQRARELGIKELFAVTSRTSFFGRLGFATFRREKTAMFLELGGHTSAK
jgi:N-acetylglutamate synthase-like GNAT family acetyltransferase